MSLAVYENRMWKRFIEAIGFIIGAAFFCLYPFGVYRAFDRHSVGDGVAALLFPPWGVYRGVAVLWEAPPWKADYPAAAESLAILLLADKNTNGSDQANLAQALSKLHIFVAKLPKAERAKLRTAADGILAGMEPFTRIEWMRLTGRTSSSKDESELHLAEARIATVPEFQKVWRRYEEDTVNSIKTEAIKSGTDLSKLNEVEGALDKTDQLLTQSIEVAETEMKRRYADIFGSN